jgi:hypothetical protein
MLNSKIQTASFIIIALAIFISGCGSNKTTSSIPDIYTGVLGVDATFPAEGVPKTAAAGSNLLAVLVLTNYGVHTVKLSDMIITFRDTKGMFDLNAVKVKGKQVLTGDEISKAIDDAELAKLGIQGKLENVVGSIYPITITAKETIKASDTVNTALTATICYREETALSASVCIDRTPYGFQKIRKSCNPDAALTYAGQGAPVAVKKIETVTERISDDDGNLKIVPKFKIYIANVGNGMIIDKDNINLFCTDKQVTGNPSGMINRVYVDSVILGNGNDKKTLKCGSTSGKTPSIMLSKSTTNNFIICTVTDSDSYPQTPGAFVTPLIINLSYGYTSTSTPVPLVIEKDSSE